MGTNTARHRRDRPALFGTDLGVQRPGPEPASIDTLLETRMRLIAKDAGPLG